jgi:hypothetical protein
VKIRLFAHCADWLSFAGLLVTALVLGTIIAVGEWNDERKARRGGYESEGAE